MGSKFTYACGHLILSVCHLQVRGSIIVNQHCLMNKETVLIISTDIHHGMCRGWLPSRIII